jgi:crotonobetainyl-CoA:carnitine CoA-transferase CaiB-like acyl-CoA transferase
MENAVALPLEGVRVVEITSVVLGPLAAQILGDLGADIIKIEPPDGDTTRHIGVRRNPGMGSMFLSLNRNKRSIVLDLKQPAGLEAALKLCESADVLLHNLRPSAAKRLGLDHGTVAARNPDIIYCGTYGYRADGPYADYPAYDDIVQAASGVAELQRMAGCTPHYAPTVMADKTTALTVVYAINAALFARERHGGGRAIEVPMFETMVAFLMTEHLYGHTFDPPKAGTGYVRVLSPFRKPYQTKDGYLAVLPHTDGHWHTFLTAIGQPELLREERFADVASRTANIDQLYADLAAVMKQKTTSEWLQILDPALLPMTPLNTPDDLFTHPQLEATGFWKAIEHPSEGKLRAADAPVRFLESGENRPRRPAPRLGQHSSELLAEIGFDRKEIATLVSQKVTRQDETL